MIQTAGLHRFHVDPRTGKRRRINGCRLPRHAPVGLRLEHFVHAAALPAVGASCDYTGPAMSVISDIEGNDTFGDCVFAENAHAVAVWTGNTGKLFSYTTQQTEADYSQETGFNPSDPNTDQGADPTTDLNFWTQNPRADGKKDIGWALVDSTNAPLVRYAIQTFGNVKLWFGIPDSIANNLPNTSGFIWPLSSGPADPNNGHCIGSSSYDVDSNSNAAKVMGTTAAGVVVYTWGMLGVIPWDALAAWFSPNAGGGMAVRITPDWIDQATGNTPSGLNLSALITACNTWFGSNVPVPTPTPSPPGPGPAPTPPQATQAGVQAAIDAAFDAAFPYVDRNQAKAIADAALGGFTW